MAAVVTLTTDFGLADHYAGVMKGVIYGICRTARIVDISHGIAPYEIADGAYTISQAYRYFPKGTIHVVVVDPGVGTARRPLLAETAGQLFVAPDNGVLSMVLRREKHRVRAIVNQRYFLKNVSNTFHGRDVFAPVAAYLAAGIKPSAFGKPVTDYLRSEFDRPLQTSKRSWTGTVLKVDHFGNLITNFAMENFSWLSERPFEIAIGMHRLSGLARTYGDRNHGEIFALVGSGGYIEISANQASAAKLLGCGAGAPVDLTVY